MEKSALRKKLLSLRSSLEKTELSVELLNSLNEYKEAKVVFCYVSAHSEVDTISLLPKIAEEKILTAPYCLDDCGNMICVKISGLEDLREGRFGILEPKAPVPFPKEEIDFVIVPGIAFDEEGYRLGYGKGYYDRFLADISPYKAGICKKELLVKKLPSDEFDIKMDTVLLV